ELHVEALRAHGDALVELSKYAEARKILAEAFFAATAIGASPEAADAGIRLILVSGANLDDYAAAKLWARHVEAIFEREPRLADVRRRAALSNAEGALSYAEGEYKLAYDQLRAGLELQTEELGPEHPALADLLNNLGHAAL